MSRVDPSDEDVNRVIKVADEIKEYGGSENEIYKMVLKGGRDELAPANPRLIVVSILILAVYFFIAWICLKITMRHVELSLVDTVVLIIPNSAINAQTIKNYSYEYVPRSVQAIGVFLDTIVICTLTGFVVIMGRVWLTDAADAWFELGKLPKYLASVAELTPGNSFNSIVTLLVSLCFGMLTSISTII